MRRHVLLVVPLLVAVALAAAPAPARVRAGALVGTVGPGFTITLTQSSSRVTMLKAGSYRFVIHDKGKIHNFHLIGPGINRATTVAGTGTMTWMLTLRKGRYHYECDVHKTTMNGNFTVA
jgi:plastocyanin